MSWSREGGNGAIREVEVGMAGEVVKKNGLNKVEIWESSSSSVQSGKAGLMLIRLKERVWFRRKNRNLSVG